LMQPRALTRYIQLDHNERLANQFIQPGLQASVQQTN
jgi:hypothetical protein